ncbi:MAG: ATPase [Chitinivibrionales bacterium]|nr:ATPase [Chitinivibrionales bacterium]
MKIAIPIVEGNLSLHFGHCQEFALVDIDESGKKIVNTEMLPAPAHQPGLLPRWLHEKGATVIIAGGMGSRAQMLFKENNIEVITGASSEKPEKIIADYLKGTLVTGGNVCDH